MANPKKLHYRKIFNPAGSQILSVVSLSVPEQLGDRRGDQVYIDTEEIVLAVNIALATGRPLLVRGPAGSGKSSLAGYVADKMGWRYEHEVMTARTQARDLLWRFDPVRRLSDATTGPVRPTLAYIVPGVLWRGFDPDGVRRLTGWAGVEDTRQDEPIKAGALGNPAVVLLDEIDKAGALGNPAVVLLDEIDKADPDVPNSLLEPLGSFSFPINEIDLVAEVQCRHPILVIITSNDERELPFAFRRRCVELNLGHPSKDDLVAIAKAHFGSGGDELSKDGLFAVIAGRVVEVRADYEARGARPPSTAEFLDTIRACRELKIKPGDEAFDHLLTATLKKRTD